jgi:hypothetical protein
MAERVTVADVPAPLGLELPAEGDAVLYPEDLEDGRGVYPMAAARFADELAAADVAVRTWHDTEHTEWYGDRDPVLVTIILGIVSSAAWDAIKLYLAKRKAAQVDLTVGFRSDGSVRWVRTKGTAEDVGAVLETLRD